MQKNKYLVFDSDHLARAKNGGLQKSQATKSMQVFSMYFFSAINPRIQPQTAARCSQR
jgi:hypothetical protein